MSALVAHRLPPTCFGRARERLLCLRHTPTDGAGVWSVFDMDQRCGLRARVKKAIHSNKCSPETTRAPVRSRATKVARGIFATAWPPMGVQND
jgi:hypothetical protein